jgi:regulator of RNase E activity RraA
MPGTAGDDEVLKEMRSDFFCAMLSDVLDGLGHTGQVLDHAIRPLDESRAMVGRARTMLYADVYAPPGPDENHYALEIALVDDLRPDEVVIAACGATGRIAPWGGLLSTVASLRGAAGAVMDGKVRDILQIREMGFPVFAGGIAPLDSRGRGKVIETDIPVACGGVLIRPGDIIFGDADGCLAIPAEIEDEVVQAARKKLTGENKSLEALQAGRTLTSVYEEFGVL